MSKNPDEKGLLLRVLRQLSHPLKLKIALSTTMLIVWYAVYFSPLSERVSATTSRVAVERKRITTAREIERLKRSLAPYRELGGSADVHELMRHVMRHIRSSPLRLIDLKPEKPRDLGPYEAIGLRLSFDGGFADVDQFLAWVETEKRLFRIGSIRLTPDTREAGRLSAQITLMTLFEKPAAPAKTKGEARKKT
jgi:Tfp pilus assembly protein PilO